LKFGTLKGTHPDTKFGNVKKLKKMWKLSDLTPLLFERNLTKDYEDTAKNQQ